MRTLIGLLKIWLRISAAFPFILAMAHTTFFVENVQAFGFFAFSSHTSMTTSPLFASPRRPARPTI